MHIRKLLLTLPAFALSCGPTVPSATAPEVPPASVSSQPVAEPVSTPAAATKTVSLQDVGLSASALNRSVDPCDDFYQFACGGWLASTEIPADKTRWSRGFSEIQERNEAQLHSILEEAAKAQSDDPVTQTVGAFYSSCMDEDKIEQAGLRPIAAWMAMAKRVRAREDIVTLTTDLHAHGIEAIFGVEVDQDFKDPNKVIAHLSQGGLGLPDRDYYLKDDDKSAELRGQYRAHVQRMFALAGARPAKARRAAADVLAFETELAKASKTRVEMRDPQKIYNKIDRDGLVEAAPNYDWKAYFAGLGYPDLREISVSSTEFFDAVNTLLARQKPAVWSHYLQWHILHSQAPRLTKAFVDEAFTLTQALTGQKQLQARWKRCVAATTDSLGDYVGQAFVETMFGGEAKSAAEMMVHGISDAFAVAVREYGWMDTATRERALEKREMMAYLIGYPDKWKSYDFPVSADTYAANALAAAKWQVNDELSKVGKPVDRNEWQMAASTVNAYYHPLKNHMVFPAGILQPPFYNVDASIAVNLGGMGMVVGHELTHGFDDMGSQFAGNGALENWWSPEVATKFGAKKQCVINQYNGYEPLPGLHVNGELTLGENIADMGGVKLAFRAYRELRKNAAETTIADGFNEDQQFFLSVGQAWCSKSRDELTRMLVQVDPHSPPEFRVIGSLSNLPEFAEAFECQPGSAMIRENICEVW